MIIASPFASSAIITPSPVTPEVSEPSNAIFRVSVVSEAVVVPNKNPVCLMKTKSVLVSTAIIEPFDVTAVLLPSFQLPLVLPSLFVSSIIESSLVISPLPPRDFLTLSFITSCSP